MRRSNRARGKKKRPAATPSDGKEREKKMPKMAWDDVEISSEDEQHAQSSDEEHVEDESDEDTLAEKRVRFAKDYIRRLQVRVGDGSSGEDDDADADKASAILTTSRSTSETNTPESRVNQLLEEDAFVQSGMMRWAVADRVAVAGEANKTSKSSPFKFTSRNRAHKSPITAVAISLDGKTAYTAAKDCTIIKWDLSQACQKLFTFPGCRNNKSKSVNPRYAQWHTDEVLALALSSDGRYLASGGRDKFVRVWDTKTNKYLETFTGHLDSVSCLAFQKNAHMLFSGSHDRTVKVWNLSEMAYVETLYGHQSRIEGMDSFRKERCVTAGNDNTARLFKVVDEVQLLFRGDRGESLDCIAMLTESRFVTGGSTGTISLWDSTKKKPLFKIPEAHGKGNWISAVAAVKNGDLVATGSCDGFVRFWRLDSTGRGKLVPLEKCRHPIPGFVNGIQFSQNGSRLVVVTGREHRLGRWWKQSHARNSLISIRLF